MIQSVSPDKAVSIINSKNRIFIHSVAAAPWILIEAMMRRAGELEKVKIVHLHTEGPAPYVEPEYEGIFQLTSFFVAANVREAIHQGRADYVPVFLSEVPGLFRNKILPIDIAMIQVSTPDKHGYCSLGTSIDATAAAVETARYVIAQINPQMPRTHGDGIIHISRFTYVVEHESPIYEHFPRPISEIEEKIGRNVAELVENGATLQMGIGAIPNATLTFLQDHKDLGIHTEMFSEGVIDLVERGVITGSQKVINQGKIVSSFILGTRRLYNFIDDNPLVEMLDCAYVNDTAVIRRNPKVTAINSAIEVDLTGQVCADSLGSRIYSGVGGQMDFMRGAALSKGGKPIIALPSITPRGESKIVSMLKPGAGVVTTRAHAHYVVTEYGTAYLYGKTLHQRAKALIAIAHPDHRERLEREMKTLLG